MQTFHETSMKFKLHHYYEKLIELHVSAPKTPKEIHRLFFKFYLSQYPYPKCNEDRFPSFRDFHEFLRMVLYDITNGVYLKIDF